MNYKSEEDFLKHYDSSIFEKLSMTVDILIASISTTDNDNYRKLNEKKFSILLVKRDDYPFKDMWCLPGGFIAMDERLEISAKRILKNETNLQNIYLEQLYTFSDVNRDPRMRIVSTAYMALIDRNKLQDKLCKNASWFDLEVIESKKQIKFNLQNDDGESISFIVGKKLVHKTTNNYEYEIIQNDKIAFDHPLVIATGLERLKNKIEYTDIVFNLMPKYFTLGELQQVYEKILNKKLLVADFRRRINSKVEKTDKVRQNGGHRPSALYKYNGGT